MPSRAALHSGYRPDIDGLRAIAVLLVLAFHARVAGFAGGFAGVDVFFVISGYLIFGIILEALERERFSFGQFYVRRINRIFPALIAILAATALIGWTVLYASEFEQLGRHIAGGATFSSNFVLRSETGYFKLIYRPLLHLWSLAVEEQFYLAFPLIVVVAWKYKWDLRWTLIALIEISFVVNMWQVRHGQAESAFYLPFARFWEILGGALLYHVTMCSSRFTLARARWTAAANAASIIGLGLIGATVIAVDSTTPWPGLYGLGPVVGAMLMIASGKDSWLNRRILAHPWLIAIGLISYPLYLWHWPLLMLATIVNEGELSIAARAACVIASFALAWATYALIEKPIRFGKRKTRSASILFLTLAVAGGFGLVTARGLVPSRLDMMGGSRRESWGRDWESPQDNFTADRKGLLLFRTAGDTSRRIMLVGDSHAQQYWPRFLEIADERKGKMAVPEFDLLAFGGCPFMGGVNNVGVAWDNHAWQCDDFFRTAMRYANTPAVKAIVISSYWEDYLRHGKTYLLRDPSKTLLTLANARTANAFAVLEANIDTLVRNGKHVYIVLSNPAIAPSLARMGIPRRLTGFYDPRSAGTVSRSEFAQSTSVIATMLREIGARTGAVIIDPADSLCGPLICPRVTDDGIPIYKDLNHLRSGFVRKRVHYLDRVVELR